MKSAWVGLVIGFLMLQGCAPQKSDIASAPSTSTGTSTGGALQTAADGLPTPEQMASKPPSYQYFVQYQRALIAKNEAAAGDLIGKAITSAKSEHNPNAYIKCAQEAATLKSHQKDNAGSIAILETTLKDIDSPKSDQMTLMRLDPIRAMLAGMYATNGKPDNAVTIYKQSLVVARAQNPVIHQRIAYWLRNYSDFYKYNKDTKHSDELMKEAQAELAKDPQAASQGGPGGPGGGAAGAGQAPGHG